jgi:hypothetical protein
MHPANRLNIFDEVGHKHSSHHLPSCRVLMNLLQSSR